ncbi:uncharacterized protein N7511_011266 [Penicillium nucicola]|uniref:uncharacterized protein n=1 Tax=Penicillium nucicola TaxID=1850975 RepID=UPI0025454D4D|nr:uncharacterized protein N7511_011266 [Penicillium nucicola]KAJ5742534.1 hypothetical protein N7511_011266 [Penicillium nucicola]
MTSNASKRSVCASCGKLVPDADIVPVDDGDPLLLPLGSALDRCGQRERTWNVCLSCLGLCMVRSCGFKLQSYDFEQTALTDMDVKSPRKTTLSI